MYFAEYPKLSLFDIECLLERIYLKFYEEDYDELNLNDLTVTKLYFQENYGKEYEGFVEDILDYIEHTLELKTDKAVFDMTKEKQEKMYNFIKG